MKLYSDMVGDSRFLNDLGGYTNRYSLYSITPFFSICNKVTAAWSQFNVSVCLTSYSGLENRYYRNGQEISRKEAMRIACQTVGKRIEDMNFTEY